MKTETFYPFFCGAVISAMVCSFVLPQEILPPAKPQPLEPKPVELAVSAPVPEAPPLYESLPVPALWDITEEENGIPAFYQNGGSREEVLAFFSGLLRSPELAAAILDNAEAYDIAPSLAVALCWTESRFNTRAVNRKNLNGTIDRGLFQLNSASFKHLKEQDFFDPQTNARLGMAHLRWCLDNGGSLVAGLAMYNAGTTRVHTGGAPKKTLDYIAEILAMQEQVERLFAGYSEELESRRVLTTAVVAAAEEPLPDEEPEFLPKQQRLALLRPISARR